MASMHENSASSNHQGCMSIVVVLLAHETRPPPVLAPVPEAPVVGGREGKREAGPDPGRAQDEGLAQAALPPGPGPGARLLGPHDALAGTAVVDGAGRKSRRARGVSIDLEYYNL